MIVATSLRPVAREVWKPLTVMFVWDVVVTVAYYIAPFSAPALPVTLFGSALAIFLGFRSNIAYARWWEARTLWGLMVNASRNLARQAGSYLDDAARPVVLDQITYVNALRRQLRGEGAGANSILDTIGRRIEAARRAGSIDAIQQSSMERVLVDIANAQGGMERIKNTPLPIHYRLLPNLFTHILCLLLPIGLVDTLGFATPLGSTVAGFMFMSVLRVSDDLDDPFANKVHDVPMNALCRTIEIDLLESLGDEAPELLTPDAKGVLW